MRAVILLIASAGYAGYIPVVPGTFGTLPGIPLFWAFDAFRQFSLVLYVAAFAAFVFASCWLAGKAEEFLAEHDSRKIVIDEVAGYLAATLFLPMTWRTVLLAFLIFRVLDVLKPFPAGWVDARLPGGYGVVLDDVVAGLYTNLAIRIISMVV